MTMQSDAELRDKFSTIESFHKESLALEINPNYLPPAVLAQCTVSYHKFVEQMIKSFGVPILNETIDANVEILYRSINRKNQLDGLIRFSCSNLKFAVNSVKLALRRSTHDYMRALLRFNGGVSSRIKYPIIEYTLPKSNVLAKPGHNCQIFKFGERNDRFADINSR